MPSGEQAYWLYCMALFSVVTSASRVLLARERWTIYWYGKQNKILKFRSCKFLVAFFDAVRGVFDQQLRAFSNFSAPVMLEQSIF